MISKKTTTTQKVVTAAIVATAAGVAAAALSNKGVRQKIKAAAGGVFDKAEEMVDQKKKDLAKVYKKSK